VKGRDGTERGGEGTRPHPFTPPNPYFWTRPCTYTAVYMTRSSAVAERPRDVS